MTNLFRNWGQGSLSLISVLFKFLFAFKIRFSICRVRNIIFFCVSVPSKLGRYRCRILILIFTSFREIVWNCPDRAIIRTIIKSWWIFYRIFISTKITPSIFVISLYIDNYFLWVIVVVLKRNLNNISIFIFRKNRILCIIKVKFVFRF